MTPKEGDVRKFYEDRGWERTESGKYLDTELFGVQRDSPAKVAAHRRRMERVRACYRAKGQAFLEIGCGANPATDLSGGTAVHTCVDLARSALRETRRQLGRRGQYVVADAAALPFPDESFSAVYSAHMLYHIEDPVRQGMAFREIARVLCAPGDAVCIYANPFPLLSPITAAKQLVKRIPWLWRLALRIRPKRVLQYHPCSIRWIRRVCPDYVRTRVLAHSIPSNRFGRALGDGPVSSLIVRLLSTIESAAPSPAAHVSSYIIVHIRKARPG